MFVKMNKEGSTLSGLMDMWALSMSMNLQYGVPLDVLCTKMAHARFEPMGMTPNKEIPMAKSFMDYFARWLALKFLPKERAMAIHNHDLVEEAYATGSRSKDAFAMRLPVIDEGSAAQPSFFATGPASASMSAVAEKTSSSSMKAELAKLQGYTGSLCGACSSSKMKRNGSCELCMDCGATSGCS